MTHYKRYNIHINGMIIILSEVIRKYKRDMALALYNNM